MEILVILFGIGAAIFALRRPRFTPPKTQPVDPSVFPHFQKVDSLFVNRAELAFFHALSRQLPRGHHLLTKPRLEDVIAPRRDDVPPKLYWQLRGRVKSRHVDFLIMDDNGCPLAAIELDGSSHDSEKARNGDVLKNGVFRAAGLPLYRVKTGEDFAGAARKIIAALSAH